MLIKFILIFVIIAINSVAFAKERIIEVSVDYIFSSTAEIDELRNLAREQARFLALEELGTYIKSNTEINLNTVSKDDVIVLASSAVKEKADNEKFQYVCINKEANLNKLIYTAIFETDDTVFNEKVKLLKNKDTKYSNEISKLVTKLKNNANKNKEAKEKSDLLLKKYIAQKSSEVEKGLERLDGAIKISKLEELAFKAYNDGNYVLAALCLKKEAELDKKAYKLNQERILARLGYSYREQYDYEKAKLYFKESLKENPKFAYAASGLADIYLAEHDYVNARDCLEIAVADFVKKPYITSDGIKLACTYMAFNEDEKAMSVLDEAELNIKYALPTDKNKLKVIICDLKRELLWLISTKKKWNVDMNSWEKDYYAKRKNSYSEYYKLTVDDKTYMIIEFTTIFRDFSDEFQCYDWIGVEVLREDGEFIKMLEGESHSV